MKVNWGFIKIVILVLFIGVLFGFGSKRNEARNLNKIEVRFVDDGDPLITHDAVNKLLIQNEDSITSIVKETLVLNEMEQRLLDHPMIKNAEVFVTVDGALGANIEQRKPIARVAATPDYYLDLDGLEMPLSTVHAVRVPVVTGRTTGNLKALSSLLVKIHEDDFMTKLVVGLDVKNNGRVELLLRTDEFRVHFGKPEDIERKFRNFKAFYQNARSNNLIGKYRSVDLQFGDQVVATKK